MSKKYIELNNSPQAIYLTSLIKSSFEQNKKKRKRPFSKQRIAKLSASLVHSSKQRLTENNAEEYLKKSRLNLSAALPAIDSLTVTTQMVDEIYKKMASAELYLYDKYKTGGSSYPDVFLLFEDQKNVTRLRSENVLSIYTNLYLKQMAKEQITGLIPENPKDEFIQTRKMTRHFVLHMGLTNTGKTYHSLVALKKAESGAYLSPLRLLALEVQEKLNADNVPCSLLTGEEEDILDNAKHVSSTVEKADYSKRYECVVIDECQLISDESRGCWWTKAILGVKSDTLHLCAAPEAEQILIKIIEDCNDTYEVIHHKRDTELVFSKTPFSLHKTQKGDALVVFSRKSVLRIAEELNRFGIKASMIYGALPYKTRKEQLKLFLDGKTHAVVATDAIGMGLNLPIKRIVFLESEKFDGTVKRELVPWEVKQIAGRAGRKGLYDKGYVVSSENADLIKKNLNTPNETVKYAYLGFSDVLTDIDCDIVQALKVWKSIPTGGFYIKQDISRTINLCEHIKNIYKGFDKKELLKLSSIPFDEGNRQVLELFDEYVLLYSYEYVLFKPFLTSHTLNGLESYYKCLDLYYSFSKSMGYTPDLVWLRQAKYETAERINKLLMQHSSSKKRRCSICNRPISKNVKSDICIACAKQFGYVDL